MKRDVREIDFALKEIRTILNIWSSEIFMGAKGDLKLTDESKYY